MRVIAVDPDPVRLSELSLCIREIYPDSVVAVFGDPMLAVKYGVNNTLDALYTAIDMKRLSGFDVARMLREGNAGLLVNFIAADESRKRDAMRLGMNSYTVAPVTAEKLRAAENEKW